LNYELQRSTDSRSFITIGTIAAAGNSNTEKNYSYTDRNIISLGNIVYYRLKMNDADGRFFVAPCVLLVPLNRRQIYTTSTYRIYSHLL
jgi:hypothetical protein